MGALAEPPNTADGDIVLRVLAGESAAFRPLVERHQHSLRRILYRLVGNADDAAELTQQAFLAAYAALARYDPKYPFSPWFVRIGVNLAKDHLKSTSRREVANEPDALDRHQHLSGESPEQHAVRSEWRVHLTKALQLLSLTDREILVLKDVEERSYEEIRTLLDRPITALKIRAVRARQRLRLALDRVC